MKSDGNPPQTLSKDDVLLIHERLIEDFADSLDPISPPGVRSEALLESAISRQHVGIGTTLKYPTVHENAATLLFGLCLDHPFHNGNKRTALVALLAHLDKNKYCLFRVSEDELFRMITEVATHTFYSSPSTRKQTIRTADEEVAEIAQWVDDHLDFIERGEREVTYRELSRLLGQLGYLLENPKGGGIDVIRRATRQRIGSIPFSGDKRVVPVNVIKLARRMCHLTEEFGIDSYSFYDEGAVVDEFINRYRTVLRRLART
jgi:death-on-curing family protein